MRIEELQQQRESAESSGELSQHLLGKLRKQMVDGQALEWSIGYLARMVIAIAKYPRFADRAARQRCGEQVRQTSAAPGPILIDRFEPQGIQKYLTNAISHYCHPSPAALGTGLACRREALTRSCSVP